ncbi:MAG: hypothetical protein WCR21_07890, partial [Bacteroidota bacterium]
MAKRMRSIKLFLVLFIGLQSIQGWAQCGLNAYIGVIPPSSGTTFNTYFNYGPGYYFAFPVLNGGSYAVSTCGASIDTQLSGWDPSATSVVFFNDDNGPLCSGSNASVDNYVPNFTNYMYVQVSQYYCNPGGSASINLYVRQNDNIVFTSSGASMCSGQTRALSATPANVGSTPGGYGNPGTFSGTGVSGNVFTAPMVASPTNFTITYTFGYVSHQQIITVNPLPTVSGSAGSAVVCFGSSTTLNGSGASTYAWTGGVTNGVPFSPSSSGTYSVTGTSAAGCTSSNVAAVFITVNALPTLTASTINSVCAGNTINITAGGASNINWYTTSTGGTAVYST